LLCNPCFDKTFQVLGGLMNNLFLVFLLISSVVFSATGPAPYETDQSVNKTQFGSSTTSNKSKILGNFEARPSYRMLVGEFHSEDSATLGYQFDQKNSVVYKQDFNTNIYEPKSAAVSGLNASLADGYLKEKFNDLYNDGKLSLSYEGRQYLPTSTVRRDAGMVTALRNYVKLKYQATSNFALSFEEVPVIHIYSSAGTITGKGPLANPVFENRASVGLEYVFSDKIKFMCPFLVSDLRTRGYSSLAENNEKWLHRIWINPEVYYTVNSNVIVGLGFYSENLIQNNNFTDMIVDRGIEQGTVQFIVSTSL